MARPRFRLAPFRSPLLRPHSTSSGYVRCFSSPAYPRPDYVFIRRSAGSSPAGVPPFGHPRLPACARLPEAFRRYATSFIGTNDPGIHPTPSFTVPPRRGVAPVALITCLIAHPRRGPDRLSRSPRGVPAPALLNCQCASQTSPPAVWRNDQTATGDQESKERLVEMRRLELLTPSVQRRCSPN